MSELTVDSWHRKGRHRLYVYRSDRTSIGYWDLVANEPRPNHPGDLDALVRQVRRWTAEHPDEAAWWMTPEQLSRWSRPHPTGSASDGNHRATDPRHRAHEEPRSYLAADPAGAEVSAPAGAEVPESPVRALWGRVRRTNRDGRNRRIGAGGEEKVGALLERVAARDSRWRAPIHSLSVGERDSDVDHVFVGSGGVFTVSVKHHPRGDVAVDRDRVRVNGYDWHYVDKCRHQARRAAELLSAGCGFAVRVESLIVIVGAKHLHVGRPSDGVHLIEAAGLAKWLRWRPDVYADGIVELVYNAARRSTAWRTPKAG